MNVIVTCVYNQLSGTAFGGRPNRNKRYINSLMAIAKSGCDVFCFTAAKDYPEILGCLRSNKITNVTLVVEELHTIPHSAAIQKIKKEDHHRFDGFFWKARCVEIMWGKFWMISTVLNNKKYTNAYWIDSGFSHADVISPKFVGGAVAPITEDYLNADLLFNPGFLGRVNTLTKNKILVFMATVPHNRPIERKYNKCDYTTSAGAIGGMFGGNRELMVEMCLQFKEKAEALLKDRELCSEESIISAIVNDSPDMFYQFIFDTFYHEHWIGYYNPSLINLSSFFDKVVE